MGQVDDVIGRLLKKVQEGGLLPSVERIRYSPYSMAKALNAVEALGRTMNPKFVIDSDNKFAYTNMIKWVHGDDSMECIDPDTGKKTRGDTRKGIYLCGPTGTGKTWCLDIMAAYCMADEPSVFLGGKKERLRWKSVRCDKVCDDFMNEGELRKYKSAPVICFHDIGAEPQEVLYMGTRTKPMKEIMEYRGDRTDVITLFTSNIPFRHQRFAAMYGDRCASRLRGMCNYLEIKGNDRRK